MPAILEAVKQLYDVKCAKVNTLIRPDGFLGVWKHIIFDCIKIWVAHLPPPQKKKKNNIDTQNWWFLNIVSPFKYGPILSVSMLAFGESWIGKVPKKVVFRGESASAEDP